MFKDAQGHVHWDGVTEYTDAPKALAFLDRFPDVPFPVLHQFTHAKAKFDRDMASGARYMTVNDVRQPMDEAEAERHIRDAAQWGAVSARLAAVDARIERLRLIEAFT